MSGPGTDYDDAAEGELEAALDRAWQDFDGSEDDEPATGNPTQMIIRAEVEWAGELARTPIRTVNLAGLDLTKVQAALTVARQAHSKAESAGSSLRASGWHAQLRELTRNARGTAATDRAGLTVTRDTLSKWLAEDRAPNAANQARIAEAYRDVRDQVVREAQDKAGRANHQVAEALNRSLANEFSADVRFREIDYIQLFY